MYAGDNIMGQIKIDEAIKILEEKQKRTSKEESSLRELKKLEEEIKKIDIKKASLGPAEGSDKMSGEYRELVLESLSYARKANYILMDLGLIERRKSSRPIYTPLTEEEKEDQRKRTEEERKEREEERRRKMREEEFAEWKRKKESGELEFEEYMMRKQFMQIVLQQQEEILQAIRAGMANTQSALKDNAEQTARAEEWYRTRREKYRIQDELMRDFFKK